MVELNGVRIWAITVAGGQTLPPRKLVCGTLARPLPSGPADPPRLDLPARLVPPGRPDLSLPWNGWFELATGEVAGVYGATVEPIG